MTGEGVIVIETVAEHEAGHAVMRWLCGWSATALTANEDGSGTCAGTGRRVEASEKLQVTLAGPAAEISYGIFPLDWAASRCADFDSARRLLAQCMWLVPPGMDVEAALKVHFDAVCHALWPFADLVTEIGDRLTKQGRLSARSVAALCREQAKRKSAAISARTR
jgi:hypothetical protein